MSPAVSGAPLSEDSKRATPSLRHILHGEVPCLSPKTQTKMWYSVHGNPIPGIGEGAFPLLTAEMRYLVAGIGARYQQRQKCDSRYRSTLFYAHPGARV